jgi:hypothetical protein
MTIYSQNDATVSVIFYLIHNIGKFLGERAELFSNPECIRFSTYDKLAISNSLTILIIIGSLMSFVS